jgi:hypothetical protein
VGLRAVLDVVVKRKPPSPRRESNPRTTIVQPVIIIIIIILIIIIIIIIITRRNSSGSKVTDYGLDDRGSIPGGVEIFHEIQTSRGAHPASYLSKGRGRLFRRGRIKRSEREAQDSLSSGDEFKNTCFYLHAPYMPSWCVFRHRGHLNYKA